MDLSLATADKVVADVVSAFSDGSVARQSAIEALSAPVYVTNPEGIVTHFNSACISFAGRRPIRGRDRWCVSWRLLTNEGADLPHEKCPMALAIRGRRSIRGLSAVAERPDGTRVAFMPFPTPIFSRGELVGAVNILIDITDLPQIEWLREEARRCRRLADGIGDWNTAEILKTMANEYEAKAREFERIPGVS